jgi:hypothetical protein
MTKSFVENFNRSLRSDLACFRAADAVRDGENAAQAVIQKSVFIQGAPLVEPAVAKR